MDESRLFTVRLIEAILDRDTAWLRQLGSPKAALSQSISIWRSKRCVCDFEENFLRSPEIHIHDKPSREDFLTCVGYGRCSHFVEEDGGIEMIFYPIHVVVCVGDIELLIHVISLGVDVNSHTKPSKYSALLYVLLNTYEDDDQGLGSERVKLSALDALCKVGADISHCTDQGDGALHAAVRKADDQLLDLLLHYHAPLNQKDQNGQTPLLLALKFSRMSNAQQLIEAGCSCEGSSFYLSHLMRSGNLDIAKQLLESGECRTDSIKQYRNYLSPLDTFLDHFSGEDDYSMEVLKLIIENGADVNHCSSSESPLILATYHENLPAVRLLMQHGADVNLCDSNGYSPVHFASWDGYLNILKLLLEGGGNGDSQTNDKNTPLTLACHGNRLETVTHLVQLGCNVHNVDKDNDTALHYASFHGSVEISRLLLQCGADPEAESDLKVTPLWNAVYSKSALLVLRLLREIVRDNVASRGVDQAANSDVALPIYDEPHTPLYVACDINCPEVAKLLVTCGLDLGKEKWLHDVHSQPLNLSHNQELQSWLINRLHNVPSLLHLSRSVIRTLLGRKLLDAYLPIPMWLTGYLTLKHVQLEQ